MSGRKNHLANAQAELAANCLQRINDALQAHIDGTAKEPLSETIERLTQDGKTTRERISMLKDGATLLKLDDKQW